MMRSQISVQTLIFVVALTSVSFTIPAMAQQPGKNTPPVDVQKTQNTINSLFDFGTPATQPSQPQQSSTTAGGNRPIVVPSAQPSFGIAPKRGGIIRIGLVSTASEAPEDQIQASLSKMSVLINGVPGASPFEAVALYSSLTPLIAVEARAKDCDYILTIDTKSQIKPKKSWNPLGNIFRVGVEMATSVANIRGNPNGSTVVEAANRAANSASQVENMLNSISKLTKKGNSVAITYSLYSANGTQLVAATTESLTAKNEGEQILQSLLVNIGNKVLVAIPVAK